MIAPVLLFAAMGTALAAFASLRLTPLAIRESTRHHRTNWWPRSFPRRSSRASSTRTSPTRILYVGDVRPGPVTVWRAVFMADVTPPEQRTSGMRDKADGPLITVAREAIAVSDPKNNRIQLSLRDYATHEMGKDGMANDSFSPRWRAGAVRLAARAEIRCASSAMNTRQLLRRYTGRTGSRCASNCTAASRFRWPASCWRMVGIPLGIATRKGGKSAGYVIALFLAFFCYHLSSVSLIGVARQRTLPVPVAIWLPDVVFGMAGLIFLSRMERPGDSDLSRRHQERVSAGCWRG